MLLKTFFESDEFRAIGQAISLGTSRGVLEPDLPLDIDLLELFASDLVRHLPEDNSYAVGRDGRIFSCRRNKNAAWRILRPSLCGSRKQYARVSLGVGRSRMIHQLVAKTYLGVCPKGQEVRHLDGNSRNNHCINLAYGTRSENMADMRRHGTSCRGTRNAMAILDEASVQHIRRRHKRGETQTAIALHLGVSIEAVSQIVRRKRWGWLP